MWAESVNKNPKNNKTYNNDSNFKYNPNQNKGNSDNNGANKKDVRCSYCNIKGHAVATCRFRQKHDYQNADNGGAGTIWCNYCKCAGHLIAVCKKRMYKESKSGNNSNSDNNTGANANTYNDRKCYRCNETTHIAKYCPKHNQNF